MIIEGAVLEEVGSARPYSQSRPIRLSKMELDPPGAGEVLIRIEAAGLCHSDLSVVDGNRPRPVPMLLGHEASGLVQQVGPGVSDLREGQRVVATFLPRCGQCKACATEGVVPCLTGSNANSEGTLLGGSRRLRRNGQPINHHLGVSGFATHAVIDRTSLVPVSDDVPPEVAALLGCAVLTGGGAVLNVGKPKPGQRVIVVGLGGVGMAALLTSLSQPDIEVIGVDALNHKLERALELGAHGAYTPVDIVTNGVKADIVIEAAGNLRAFETAVALAGPGGRTVSVGLPPADARAFISPLALVANAQSIIGSYLGSAVPERDIPVFAELWREGRLPVESLVSSRIDLNEINEGMDSLADGTAIRQILRFPDA